MLYDFYHHQNSKKPGSVHASYIIDGAPRIEKEPATNGQHVDGDDIHMQSSPYMSSSMPREELETGVPIKCITLAKQEDLEGEDPLYTGKQYGVIHNRHVKRRTGRRSPGVAPAVAGSKPLEDQDRRKPQVKHPPTSKSAKPSPQQAPSSSQPPFQSEGKSESKQFSRTEKKPAPKPTTLKREQSDFFKSVSKPKPKIRQEDSASSASSAVAAGDSGKGDVQEDEPTRDESSEVEQEEDFITQTKDKATSRKSKEERAEQLRRMMMMDDDDEADENMEDPPEPSGEESQQSDAVQEKKKKKKQNNNNNNNNNNNKQGQQDESSSPEPPPVEVKSGRRRGRRKVMKKKTFRDEEGYLVTKEEPAWESFSEDEPVPEGNQRTPFSSASSIGKAKKGGGVGKAAQGNIMSFFGKK
ncbi:MAG: hypothetical protein Q9163_000894 [Psora crenata]